LAIVILLIWSQRLKPKTRRVLQSFVIVGGIFLIVIYLTSGFVPFMGILF